MKERYQARLPDLSGGCLFLNVCGCENWQSFLVSFGKGRFLYISLSLETRERLVKPFFFDIYATLTVHERTLLDTPHGSLNVFLERLSDANGCQS
jgi:hypothetical protein